MSTRSRSKLIVVKERFELARVAAEWIAKSIGAGVKARGGFTIALAGGSTPRPVYEELGNSDLADQIPWAQVDFFFGDERAVPIDDPGSNYRMVRESLCRSHPEALGRLRRMPADAANKKQAAGRYGRLLPDELDLVILGMGSDGHIASLFPGDPALKERVERVVCVTGPTPPRERMTITPPVIEKARSILVLLTGAEKGTPLSRALGGPLSPEELPARLARRGTWVVDQAAAAKMISADF